MTCTRTLAVSGCADALILMCLIKGRLHNPDLCCCLS